MLYATLPFPVGLVAAHYWFAVDDEGKRCERWEVWQSPNAGGTCVGHLHCNLKPPEADVGGGPARVAAQWEGDTARKIHAVLLAAGKAYPFCHRYAPWPGPNSNTFAAWVLRSAGIDFRLPWKAIGRSYEWQGG